MKIEIVESSQIPEGGCTVIPVFEKDFSILSEPLAKAAQLSGFKGEQDETLFLVESAVILVGVESILHDLLRSAAAAAIKVLKSAGFKNAGTVFEDKTPSFSLFQAFAQGALLGDYAFDFYLSQKSDHNLETLYIGAQDSIVMQARREVEKAVTIAESVNFVRDIINKTPDDITPAKLAALALEVAESNGLESVIMDEQQLEEQNMGAFLAVSRASAHAPRLIHLAYKPENAKTKVALVGKGLTYDSGGLSLKSSEWMVTMKSDKSGASAVLGIIKAVSELGLPIEVHAIIGASENMIGGNAYKPDDVLVAKNGKTIEVRNTDAEGRLVLADCLCYAQEVVQPDYLLDYATLTGACVVALGQYTTGLMGHNDSLKIAMQEASERSGELTGILPFNRYLKKLIKSEVADVCNIGSARYGGAITAALFLDHFIEEDYKHKWLHLDIAGPAYVEKSWGYNPHGASGAGVRMSVAWLESLLDEES